MQSDGSKPGCPGEVGNAHGGIRLAALSAAAHIAREVQDKHVQQLVVDAGEGRVQALYIASHYDASPLHVQFGALSDLVTPHARFLYF